MKTTVSFPIPAGATTTLLISDFSYSEISRCLGNHAGGGGNLLTTSTAICR